MGLGLDHAGFLKEISQDLPTIVSHVSLGTSFPRMEPGCPNLPKTYFDEGKYESLWLSGLNPTVLRMSSRYTAAQRALSDGHHYSTYVVP